MPEWLSEAGKGKGRFIVLSLRIPLKDYTARLNIQSGAEVQSHHLWFLVMPSVLLRLICRLRFVYKDLHTFIRNVSFSSPTNMRISAVSGLDEQK